MKLYALSVSASFPDGPPHSTRPHPSLDRYLSSLNPAIQAKVQSYRLLDDARRSLLGQLLRRHVASASLDRPAADIFFDQTNKGRPYVAVPSATGLDFNVAHDGDWVILACLTARDDGRRVGVDVMALRNPWEGETVQTFAAGISDQLTPAEQRYLHAPTLPDATRLSRALSLWTLKEAYVKATGLGLHFDLTRIEFNLARDVSDSQWTCVEASVDGVGLSGWEFGVRAWRGSVVAWAVEGGRQGAQVEEIEVLRLEDVI